MQLKPLSLHSEPYGSTGNIGENFRRLLGAPALNPLQTVIRESVQNIADAALPGHGPEVQINLRCLTAAQKAALASITLQQLPAEPYSRACIEAMLAKQHIVVMEICDFGTVGLGGPTRADRIPIGTQRADFINFLRNIGTARDSALGGGTYGFGKVALYRASMCSTIIVDTLPVNTGLEERRLIGCHIGPSFATPEKGMLRSFTGRHWWGISDPHDHVVDPLKGIDAQAHADALGLPRRDTDRTGTSIMILDFDTEEEDIGVVGKRVVEALLWSFWPRMTRDTPLEKRFACRVEVNGIPLPIPAPEEIPQLELFTKAIRAARTGKGNEVHTISSKRPAKHLGTLALEKGLKTPRHPLVPEGGLFPDTSRHIALMRPVELVVRYLEGTALPDERLEWSGVFIASSDEEVERAFADAEPPAHDDWIPDNLPKGHSKTYVKLALSQLKSHAAQLGVIDPHRPGNKESGPSLARIAGRLGATLEGVGGDGASPIRSRGGSSRVSPTRARATRPIFLRLEMTSKGKVAVFSTEVQQDAARTGVILSARASVAVDGVSMDALGEDMQPDVLSIRSDDCTRSSMGSQVTLQGSEGSFEVRVKVPDNCAVTLDVDVVTRSS